MNDEKSNFLLVDRLCISTSKDDAPLHAYNIFSSDDDTNLEWELYNYFAYMLDSRFDGISIADWHNACSRLHEFYMQMKLEGIDEFYFWVEEDL